MIRTLAIQAALAGPAVAGLAWLALVRWPLLRRLIPVLLGLAANGAAWAVFWFVYRGDDVAWRGFEPTLLGATLFAAGGFAVLLTAVRADAYPAPSATVAIVALGVSTSAVGAAAYSDSIAVQASVLALPTLAAAGAALSGRGRRDAKGLIGLAAADLVTLAGFTVLYARLDGVEIATSPGLPAGLILLGAAAKAGALPGIATWRLVATEGAGASMAAPLRLQGIVLAGIAGILVAGADISTALAATAAVAVLLCGLWGIRSRLAGGSLAAVLGVSTGIPFLALGLGGAVGVRAFLLVTPPLLLASGALLLLGLPDPSPATEPTPEEKPTEATAEEKAAEPEPAPATPEKAAPPGSRLWAGLGALSLGVTIGSLVGVPPGGGFPGTWLTLSLAQERAQVSAGWPLATGAAAVGLALALYAGTGLVRAARARAVPAVAGAVVSLVMLYVGTQPVRLGIGWWIRVEQELSVAEILPSAGAPGLPIVGGRNLLLALAPALFLAMVVVVAGRGFRATEPGFVPLAGPPPTSDDLSGRLLARLRPMLMPLDRLRRIGAGFGVAAGLEVAALVLAVRLVLLAAQGGFL